MECDIHRPCQPDEFFRPGHIDVSVCREHADHHAVGSEGFGHEHVLPHYVHFLIGIKEVTAARPDDHLQADTQLCPGYLDGSRARSRPALHQVIAQLHAVRATFLGSQRSRYRIYAYFHSHASA